MITTLMMAGIITAFFVCLALPVSAAVYCYKTRSSAGGTLFVLILGIAAAVLTTNIASFLGGILQLNQLAESQYILSLVLYALLIAAVDLGLRMYTAGYMNKTGIGKQKGIALAAGYIIGQSLSPVVTLFTHVTYALAIKANTFMDAFEEGTEIYNEALKFQDNMVNGPEGAYFVHALGYISLAVLQIFLVLFVIRGFLENKKAVTAGIVVTIRFLYEGARQVIIGLCMEQGGQLYSESTELLLNAVFSAVVIIAGIYVIRLILNDFPQGREPLQSARTHPSSKAASEEQKKKQAWQEVSRLNTRSISYGQPENSDGDSGNAGTENDDNEE